MTSPEKLGQRVRRELQRPGNELYLSPISIWEARHLAFTFAVAAMASQIELPEPDPGDVFLAATALTSDLTLVTADRQLLDCSGPGAPALRRRLACVMI